MRDIELVAIPLWDAQPAALFETITSSHNRLYEALRQAADIRWIKPGVPDIVDWPIRADGKYWRGVLEGGVKLDLFLCSSDNWGVILLVRTGSAAFSQALATHAKRNGTPIRDGFLTDPAGQPMPTPTEESVFRALRLLWIPPSERRDGTALDAAIRTSRAASLRGQGDRGSGPSPSGGGDP